MTLTVISTRLRVAMPPFLYDAAIYAAAKSHGISYRLHREHRHRCQCPTHEVEFRVHRTTRHETPEQQSVLVCTFLLQGHRAVGYEVTAQGTLQVTKAAHMVLTEFYLEHWHKLEVR